MVKYRFLVELKPGVSITYDTYSQIIEVDGPQPLEAVEKAIKIFAGQDTQIWQSDDVTIRVKRVH